jgi:hypothetical protein
MHHFGKILKDVSLQKDVAEANALSQSLTGEMNL